MGSCRCTVMSSANDTQVLSELGMSPAAPSLAMPAPPAYLAVQLDGRVVGAMPAALAGPAVLRLRAIKAARLLEDDRLPPTNDIIELEVLTRSTEPHPTTCNSISYHALPYLPCMRLKLSRLSS